MPNKPPKRPKDTAQLAKMIVDIAAGELPNEKPRPKDQAAVEMGRKGGLARGTKDRTRN